MGKPDLQKKGAELAKRHKLDDESLQKLLRLAEWSTALDISGTAITAAEDALDVHIADSLVGLQLPVVANAESIADIGSGMGFPGLVLAVMLPQTQVTLVDSVRKKMEEAARVARELELENVECVWSRVEELSAVGSEARAQFDVVTARALAPLAVLIEYAAPLLKDPNGDRSGGSLVAWKGQPQQDELDEANRVAGLVGMAISEPIEVSPFRGSGRRSIHSATKTAPTSESIPRRPGIALRRPLA